MLVENSATASAATTVYITLTNGNNGSSMMLSTPKNGIMKRAVPNGTLDHSDLIDPAKVSNKPVQKFMVSISATNSPTIGRRNMPATAAVLPTVLNSRVAQQNEQQTRNLLFKEQLRQKIDKLTLNDLKLNLKTIFPDNKGNPNIDAPTPQKAHSTPDLMQRIDESNSTTTSEKKRRSKRVMFADDRGFQLVTIRILSEPRDFPPNFRYQDVVDLLGCGFYNTNGINKAATSTSTASSTDDDDVFMAPSPASSKPATTWQCKFKQPASDYMMFRQKLDQNKVALENVMIKNEENNNNNNNKEVSPSSSAAKMTGTIKVKNLSFEKSVVLRLSTDQWSTYRDHQCNYKPYRKQSGSQNNSNNNNAPTVRCPDMYDTFDFEIDLKNDDNPQCSCVQFCVKYSSNGVDYWDSNDGSNFVVELVTPRPTGPPDAPTLPLPPPPKAPSAILTSLCRDPVPRVPASTAHYRPQVAGAGARARPKNFPVFQASSNFCPNIMEQQQNDAFCLQMNNWTQFASWNHLSSEAPYW